MEKKFLLLTIIWQIASCGLVFASTSSGANIEFIPAAKNFGIGVLVPTAKLDINGQIMIRGGSPGVTKILSSDATGQGSWVSPSSLLGGDADTLDTLDSLQFLRSDTTDNFTSGVLITNAGTRFDVNGELSIADTDITLDGASTTFTQSTGSITLVPASGKDLTGTIASGGEFKINTSDLVFNGTNARVGIGTANPSVKLEVNGTIKGLVINGGTANFTNLVTNSFTNTGSANFDKIIVTNNVNGTTANFSTGNFTNLVISGVINGNTSSFDGDFTNGSVLFSNADGVISQDNSHFFWDRNNKRLALNHFSPDMVLDVNGAIVLRNIDDGSLSNPDNGAAFIYLSNGAAASNPGDLFAKIKEAGTTKTIKIIDFNNGRLATTVSASTVDGIDSLSFLRSDTSDNYSSGTLTFDAGTTLAMAAGSTLDINSTSVSIADTDITLDGANTSFTQSSGNLSFIPASGSNLALTIASGGEFRINTNDLVFNGTNARVGIGTADPSTKLDVNGTIRGLSINGSSANFSGTMNTANLISSGSVNGTTANFVTGNFSTSANVGKLISSGVVNGTTANFTDANFTNLVLTTANITTVNSTDINNSGTITTAKLISSGVVNGTTANFTKVIASGTINGANANFSNASVSGIFNGSSSSFDGDFTNGSVLFSNAEGVISENNSQIYWDRVNSRFSLGSNTPNEKVTIDGVVSLKENLDPSPTAGFAKLYVRATNSKLYYQDDTGISYNLTNASVAAVGTPAGADTHFQFNDNGLLAANGALSFAKVSKTLNVAADASLDINSTSVSIADTNISFDSASGVTFTPTAGQNLNMVLSGTGDFTVNTNLIYADTSTSTVGIMISNPNETLTVNGTLSLKEGAAAGTTSNFGKFYVKSADSKLYFKDSLGTEFDLCSPSLSVAINNLSDAISDKYSNLFMGNGSGLANTSIANTAIGIDTLRSNISGSANTAMGYQALYTNNGSTNSAFGYRSLYANSQGTGDIAFGSRSLYSNINSNYNTALGASSLQSNTTGLGNLAVGTDSLSQNTNGSLNTAIGASALRANVSGNENLAVGYQTLFSKHSSHYNTAIGYQSQYYLTNDPHNTSLGYQALLGSRHGNGNTAIGPGAMSSMSNGSYNVAIGFNAGKRAVALSSLASNGVHIGYNSGYYDSGDNNIFLGHNTGNGSITGSNNILIGYNNNLPPSASSSNQLDIADTIYGDLSNKNIGIGTTSIDTKLEVNGVVMTNVFVSKALYSNSSGANVTIDWNNGNEQKIILGHNVTFTFTAPSNGVGTLSLILQQDGTGSRTVTWPVSVKWPGGTAPTLSTSAGYMDVVSCVYENSVYLCQIGLDFR